MDALLSVLRGRRLAVLTGAGCSTESGIPDYRGPTTPPRRRPPIQHCEFIERAEVRRRYWARSLLGWPRLATARPNPAHAAVAALEARGQLTGLITQNVDGLHHAAGSRAVIELHGALRRVRCLGCGEVTHRDDLQARLLAANPGWVDRAGAEVLPDGDVDLEDAVVAEFGVVACGRCGATLMPDVVFFGGNVARPVVDAAWAMIDAAEALLVVGSSLTVFSGYRFVRGAAERGLPIAILNQGPTRGDPHATARLEAPAGLALPRLVAALQP
jgi:NAD-dependent SIR2 family protein deacetylase